MQRFNKYVEADRSETSPPLSRRGGGGGVLANFPRKIYSPASYALLNSRMRTSGRTKHDKTGIRGRGMPSGSTREKPNNTAALSADAQAGDGDGLCLQHKLTGHKPDAVRGAEEIGASRIIYKGCP